MSPITILIKDIIIFLLLAFSIVLGAAIGGTACYFHEREVQKTSEREKKIFYLVIAIAVTLSFFFLIGESNLLSLSYPEKGSLIMSCLRLVSFSCLCGLLGPIIIRPLREKAANIVGVELASSKDLESKYKRSSGLVFIDSKKWYSGFEFFSEVINDENFSHVDRNKARYHNSLCLLNIGIDRFMLAQQYKLEDKKYSVLLRHSEIYIDEAVAQINTSIEALDKNGIQYATALARKAYFGYRIYRLNKENNVEWDIKEYDNLIHFDDLMKQALDANSELAFYLQEEYREDLWDDLDDKLKKDVYEILAGDKRL